MPSGPLRGSSPARALASVPFPLDEREGRVTLEAAQRLSCSVLWELQRRYFEKSGVEAFSTNTVPHYVTNNTALAHAYAKVVLGFLRDLLGASPGSAASPGIDPSEPVTIVELGAGSGRFAHLFLKALASLRGAGALGGVRVRYVLTDFTATNVAFFREHDAFRALAREGVVDFAHFDAERDDEIRLLEAGTTLVPGSLKNPLIVIANYVFDGIRQDAFAFEGGVLHERLVTVRGPRRADTLDEPPSLSDLEVEYTDRPASFDYYEEPELNDVLRGYAKDLDGSTLLFPASALGCVRRLADLSGGRLLLLSGDRGEAHEEALRDSGDPAMAIHGSFSMPVNYHALGEYTRRRGGQALVPPHQHAHLCTSAFLLGEHPAGYAETCSAYADAFERGGPDEIFSVRRGIQSRYAELSLSELVSLIRLTRCDPRILRDAAPALHEQLQEATPAVRRDLVRLVGQVWENYFHIGEPHDLPFDLGVLLYALREPRRALELFEASVKLYGDDPRTRWNMGMCWAATGNAEEAARCFVAARLVPRRALVMTKAPK